MLRSLRKEFGYAVGSSESAIRVDTDEIDDAIKTIQEVCKKHNWELRVWDAAKGTQWYVGEAPKPPPAAAGRMNPLEAIGGAGAAKPPTTPLQELLAFWNEAAKPDKSTKGEVLPVVLVMKNFHLIFSRDRADVSATIQHIVTDKVHDHPDYDARLRASVFDPNQISGDGDTGKFLVGLMPAQHKLPEEIAPLFRTIAHELPDEDELGVILEGVRPGAAADEDDDDGAGLTPDEQKKICKFALGLTRLQAEGVFGASVVQFGRVQPEYVWQAKSQILNKEGLVELYLGKEKFEDVAGLSGAKDLMQRLLTPDEYDEADPDCRAKGALFCGAPGTGKSLIAKATGNELGLPTLMVNPGNWFGGIVGESEAKTRKGLQILKAHAPCIAVID